MFSTPESAKISDTWTSVRILGGDDLDDAGEAFMRRYGVGGYPTLLALTAGGDLVDRDLADGSFPTADDLFAAMHRADEENRAFVLEREQALASPNPEARRALSRRLLERRNISTARRLLEEILATSPTAETSGDLARVLRAEGDVEGERSVLTALVEAHPDHRDRADWRMRIATLHIAPPTSALGAQAARSETLAALERLQRTLATEGDTYAEGRVRLQLARTAFEAQRAADAAGHLTWILAHGEAEAQLDARLLQAEAAMQRRRLDEARMHARAVIEAAPEKPQAASAHFLLGDLAYGDKDLEAVQMHFLEVIRLAPDSPLARLAEDVLRSLERKTTPHR